MKAATHNGALLKSPTASISSGCGFSRTLRSLAIQEKA